MSHYDEYYESLANESKLRMEEKRNAEIERLVKNGIDENVAAAIIDNKGRP